MQGIGRLRLIPLLLDQILGTQSPSIDNAPVNHELPRGMDGTALIVAALVPVTIGSTDTTIAVTTWDGENEDTRETVATIASGDIRSIEIPVDKLKTHLALIPDFVEGEIYNASIFLYVDDGQNPGERAGIVEEYTVAATTRLVASWVHLFAADVAFDDEDLAGTGANMVGAVGDLLFLFDYGDATVPTGTASAVIQHSDDDGDEDPYTTVSTDPSSFSGEDPFPGIGQGFSIAKASLKSWVRVLVNGGDVAGSRLFRASVIKLAPEIL